MEKNKKKLIFFMPSMDGGGVEKNLVIIANYTSSYLDEVSLITFDNSFAHLFNKKINIIKVQKKIYKKKYKKYYKYFSYHILLFKIKSKILFYKKNIFINLKYKFF